MRRGRKVLLGLDAGIVDRLLFGAERSGLGELRRSIGPRALRIGFGALWTELVDRVELGLRLRRLLIGGGLRIGSQDGIRGLGSLWFADVTPTLPSYSGATVPR